MEVHHVNYCAVRKAWGKSEETVRGGDLPLGAGPPDVLLEIPCLDWCIFYSLLAMRKEGEIVD